MKRKFLAWFLVLTMFLGALPFGVSAAEGTTVASMTNPFTQGTQGSQSFRIPAMVTLDDGTIVAAADARWNTTFDGGGLDTIVAYSTNNGATWTTQLANYLGDNGNTYNGSSNTSFIDPALATDGKTVWMLVDLYPYGIALNGNGNTAPSTAVGFNSNGKLLLSNNNHSSYNYYLDGNTIYSSNGTAVSGYTVDAKFNITGNGTSSNLFYSDSPYKVVRTGYLYLTSSNDGGKSWTDPMLLPNIKTSSEQVCLVAPGRGLVTSEGTIIFPCYSYNSSDTSQEMGFLYSEDNGATWKRSASFSDATRSSESAVVELNDGTLRFFYRNDTSNLCYADYANNAWGNAVNSGISTNSNCQISAISYSKTVDGKQLILVSCPTGPNSAGSDQSAASDRLNGKIFAVLVDSDQNNATTYLTNSIAVTSNNNQFMYSCLTERADGSVAILYENYESSRGNGDYTMDVAAYDLETELGVTFDTAAGDDSSGDNNTSTSQSQTVELAVGESITLTDDSGNHESSYTAGNLDSSVATVVVKGTTVEGGTKRTFGSKVSLSSNGTYTGVITDNNENYLTISSSGAIGNTTDINDATVFTVTRGNNNNYTISDGTNYLYYNNGTLATQTDSFEWSYSSTNGFYRSSSNGPYIRYYNGSWGMYASSGSGSGSGHLCSVTTTATDPVYKTDITITGASVGTTSVVVGDTTYNITVSKKQATANVMEGESATYTNAGTSITKTPNSSVATATLSNGTLTVFAVAEGTTTLETDTTVYTVNVVSAYTETLKVSETKTISVTLSNGQYVEWTSADSSYVGVAGKYDSTTSSFTDSAYIVGNNITNTPVLVTGTVYNADGTVASTMKWMVTVTEGDADDNTSTKSIYVNIEEIENCKVYYSINGGALIPVSGTGVLINEQVTGKYQISFFAAPDDGYALTYMKSEGNQYFTLSNGQPDGFRSDAWPLKEIGDDTIDYHASYGSGSNSTIYSESDYKWGLAEGNFTLPQLKALFTQAIALGCDGTFVFTRNGTDALSTGLSFVAQRLPTVEKVITSIVRDGNTIPYTSGMVLEVGDTINYTITVTSYPTNSDYGTITYSNVTLKDDLTGGSWTPALGASNSISYTTSIQLTPQNFVDIVRDGTITNVAEFSFSYESSYSTGSLDKTSTVQAAITVNLPTYVVDFGLPVVISLENDPFVKEAEGGIYSISTPKYGTVSFDQGSKKFTYTPNQMFKGQDYIDITCDVEDGFSYAVRIIPASTVYYEDSFVTFSDNWTADGTNTAVNQLPDVLGESGNYGYDSAYANSSPYSLGSAHKVTVSGTQSATATFTFQGTGFDIIALTSNTSGTILIEVKDSAGACTYYMVDTYYGYKYENGEWVVDTAASDTLYQVPVMKVTDLAYGEYTVKVTAAYSKVFDHTSNDTYDLYFDAVRIYQPLGSDGNLIYAEDGEGWPTFIELRDMILSAGDFNAATGAVDGVVFIDGNDENASVSDYANYGPNNELYLAPGQAIAFVMTGAENVADIQIGMKSADGRTVNYTVTVDGTSKAGSLSTSTDMYYSIGASAAGKLVTITNTGDGILSVTTIKTTYNSAPSQRLSFRMTQSSAQAAVNSVTLALTAPVVPETPGTSEPETDNVESGSEDNISKTETTDDKTTTPDQTPEDDHDEEISDDTSTSSGNKGFFVELGNFFKKLFQNLFGKLFA